MNIKTIVVVVFSAVVVSGCSSQLARMGLGGGRYYSDSGKYAGFDQAWNASVGETIDGWNTDGSLYVTHTPISEFYSDYVHPRRRHDAVQMRWYREEVRDLPGRRLMNHRRYERLEVTCRDFRHTRQEVGEDGRRGRKYGINSAVCQLPDGTREHIEYPEKPRVDYTARQDRYYRYYRRY